MRTMLTVVQSMQSTGPTGGWKQVYHGCNDAAFGAATGGSGVGGSAGAGGGGEGGATGGSVRTKYFWRGLGRLLRDVIPALLEDCCPLDEVVKCCMAGPKKLVVPILCRPKLVRTSLEMALFR